MGMKKILNKIVLCFQYSSKISENSYYDFVLNAPRIINQKQSIVLPSKIPFGHRTSYDHVMDPSDELEGPDGHPTVEKYGKSHCEVFPVNQIHSVYFTQYSRRAHVNGGDGKCSPYNYFDQKYLEILYSLFKRTLHGLSLGP